MKGGAWGEDILKWATMIFAFLFGIGVAILGIWTIFNVFRAGWDAAGPQTWGALMGGNSNSNSNSNNSGRNDGGGRGRGGGGGRRRGGNRNNSNAELDLVGPPVVVGAPQNNGMEGFKLR